MRIKSKILSILLLTLSWVTYAQSGGNFEIKKSTTDAGGGRSSGGNFVITGTIAQTDASTPLSGGSYALSGGFWNAKPVIKEDMMFKDGFEN